MSVCAFQTTDYGEFTYVHTAGCTPEAISASSPGAMTDAAGLNLELKTLENTSELLGFSSFIPPDLWPGTSRRVFTGKVTLPGAVAGTRYLVAFATAPILETKSMKLRTKRAIRNTAGWGVRACIVKPGLPSTRAMALPPRAPTFRNWIHYVLQAVFQ